MTSVHQTLLDTIGSTPLIALKRICPNPKITLLLKLEFFNPSFSIKDRMVRYVIDQAEKKGLLKPGGTLIENTSGNTGASVAMIAAVRGYHAILTMPDSVSQEKQNALKAYGAEIIVTPSQAPYGSPDHYEKRAEKLAKEIPGSFHLNQYNNPLNPEAHYQITAPEIWEQTGGGIDYFVASSSTGGTISGVGRFLKEKSKEIQVIMPDPVGSVYAPYFKTGAVPTEGSAPYYLEGIGEDHITEAIDFSVVDDVIPVKDRSAFEMARRLAREEGILAGGSTGANLFVATEIAQTLKKPATIVTLACDSGIKYLSKIYNDSWLKEHGLLT